jgi:hypothetical protein
LRSCSFRTACMITVWQMKKKVNCSHKPDIFYSICLSPVYQDYSGSWYRTVFGQCKETFANHFSFSIHELKALIELLSKMEWTD